MMKEYKDAPILSPFHDCTVLLKEKLKSHLINFIKFLIFRNHGHCRTLDKLLTGHSYLQSDDWTDEFKVFKSFFLTCNQVDLIHIRCDILKLRPPCLQDRFCLIYKIDLSLTMINNDQHKCIRRIITAMIIIRPKFSLEHWSMMNYLKSLKSIEEILHFLDTSLSTKYLKECAGRLSVFVYHARTFKNWQILMVTGGRCAQPVVHSGNNLAGPPTPLSNH